MHGFLYRPSRNYEVDLCSNSTFALEEIMNNKDKHVFLIRFFEKQYAENFLDNGEIHFNPLQYFIDLENNQGDTIIGDALEGKVEGNISPESGWAFMFRVVGDKKPVTVIPTTTASIHINIPDELKQTMCISCFSWIDTDDIVEDEKTKSFKLTRSAIKRLRNFNTDKRIPIIIDANILFKRLESENVGWKDVEYYDSNDIDDVMELAAQENNIDKIIFRKRIKYSDQKEFRIIIKSQDTDSNNNIYIGNLRGVDRKSVV